MNAEHWSALAAFAVAAGVLLVLAWASRGDDYRTRKNRAAARRAFLDPPVRETQPGSNRRDLDTCNNILAATDTARKEKP